MPCRPMYMASVAAIGVKFAKRIRVPLIPPTTNAPKNTRTKPAAIMSVDLSSFMKNEATTTRKPDERADRQVDGPQQQRDGLPKRNKSQGGSQQQDIVDIECRQEIGVLAEDIKSQQNDDERERNRGRIVRLQKMTQAAHGGAGLFLQTAGSHMRSGTHGSGDNPRF